jgi:hypothetical protein
VSARPHATSESGAVTITGSSRLTHTALRQWWAEIARLVREQLFVPHRSSDSSAWGRTATITGARRFGRASCGRCDQRAGKPPRQAKYAEEVAAIGEESKVLTGYDQLMERPLRERVRDTADNVVIAFAESLRETLMERVTRPRYNDAERVALGVLDERIGAISTKAKPTQRDKDLLEVLKGIKSELEAAFDERWNNREQRQ